MKMTAVAEPEKKARKVQSSEDTSLGCLSLLLKLGNLFLCAWIVTLFWTWFLVPVFPGLKESVTLWQAIGGLVMIALVRGIAIMPEHARGNKFDVSLCFVNTTRYLLLLYFGWLLHYLMTSG